MKLKYTSRQISPFKIYDIVVFNVLKMCHCHHYVIPANFHHFQRQMYPLAVYFLSLETSFIFMISEHLELLKALEDGLVNKIGFKSSLMQFLV
jgi:hypothetical protein